jgi:hypothetical protein
MFAPLVGGLNIHVLPAISSILRLILSSPLIAFFIIFLIRSVKGFSGSAIAFVRSLGEMAADWVIFYARRLSKGTKNYGIDDTWDYICKVLHVLFLLGVDVGLSVILAYPEVAAFWGILFIPVILQLIVICLPISCFEFHVMVFQIPVSKQPLSGFNSFLLWKVESIARQEKDAHLNDNPLLDNNESSESLDIDVPMREEWPDWTCGKDLFEIGTYAKPIRDL